VVRLRFLRSVVAAAAIALFAAAPSAAPAAAGLSHLRGIAELKSWFNSTNGHPRLIFLLSPT
jgi:hypothetical protein